MDRATRCKWSRSRIDSAMSRFLPLMLVSMIGGILSSCASNPHLPVVPAVEIERYGGLWFEISRLPNRFQDNCWCATAAYELLDERTISVRNTCREEHLQGEENSIEGKAFVVEGSNNAKLRVQIFWPFRGDYWIIELDSQDYQYAIVGTPNRRFLWILAREPVLSQELLQTLSNRALELGFDSNLLIHSPPECAAVHGR